MQVVWVKWSQWDYLKTSVKLAAIIFKPVSGPAFWGDCLSDVEIMLFMKRLIPIVIAAGQPGQLKNEFPANVRGAFYDSRQTPQSLQAY